MIPGEVPPLNVSSMPPNVSSPEGVRVGVGVVGGVGVGVGVGGGVGVGVGVGSGVAVGVGVGVGILTSGTALGIILAPLNDDTD